MSTAKKMKALSRKGKELAPTSAMLAELGKDLERQRLESGSHDEPMPGFHPNDHEPDSLWGPHGKPPGFHGPMA